MALTTKITLKVVATHTNPLDLVTGTAPVNKEYAFSWASGTGANQADKLFSDTRTLAASTSEDLDLAGSLVSAFGKTITFTKIKAIIIAAASGNTNDVQVGGAAANQFINWVASATDIVNVAPGGLLCLIAPDADGYAVTAGTGDLLKLANSGAGTGVTFDIILIGVGTEA